jgi:hypothetical protein
LETEGNHDSEVVRIQFDVPAELYARARRYFHKDRDRHSFGYSAFEEVVNRREGRDTRLKHEQRMRDKEAIRAIVREVLREKS